MNRLVAVSGGVDSVVLLDILSRGDDHLVVAHVDHGIRGEESTADARFVETLARKYELPFVKTELKLGPKASEDEARTGRYQFLYSQADKFKAEIVTAHHGDDLIGSIAINLMRGTGWRGLAVLNRPGIARPLLGWSKQKIYDYALEHRLEWVEDSTNQTDLYLRNRLRADILRLDPEAKVELGKLRLRQIQLRHDIDRELERIELKFSDSRYPYIQIEPRIAIELLRHKYKLTYPHAERALHAIKTGRPGTRHDLSGGVVIELSRERFVVATNLE